MEVAAGSQDAVVNRGPEEAATPQGPPAPQKFAFELIALIRTEQGQNGVKHGDYKRYRRHCKNKLRALYKALKFQHGRTKYVQRKIEAATVVDIRFLHILVFNAERAWAYAMELKKEIEGSMNLQKRRHLAARMRKAAIWARDLARIAAVRCDARGAVEAEAYAAFLSGSSLVEKQADWSNALARLTRAKHIFTTLSSLGGTADQQALYLQQVEDMEPAIRFCTYQLQKKGVAEPPETAWMMLSPAQQEGTALSADQLQAHLAALQTDSAPALPGAAQPDTQVDLTWLGRIIPIRAERLKAAVHQVQALQSQLEAQSSSMEVDGEATAAPRQTALYEKLSKALQDARVAARHAIKSSTASEADASHAELTAAEAALTGMIATRSVEHAELQARELEGRFARALDKTRKADKRDTGVSAEEVVRALDTLSRALAELADVGAHSGGRAGEALYEVATGKSACTKAARTYYTGHHMLTAGKPLEAYALFERAAEAASHTIDEAPDTTYKAYCNMLSASANTFKAVAHAEYAAKVAGQREGVESGLGGLGLTEPAAAPPTQWLLDALSSWESFAAAGKPARVYRLPFSMQPIPCRPIMLDTAAAWLQYPNLDHRLKKPEKKGVLSSLGLGWAWGTKK